MNVLSGLNLSLPVVDPTWIFLVVLLVVLLTPILLDRLHIPRVIGMILAGLLIGEHGLGVLDRDASFELFGQVGLYYIMFLAGLEMSIGGFKENRLKALTLGLLCFVIPISVGFMTNILLLKYGVATSVLLASMYASNTQVSYPIVIRYGISNVRSVSIAVGGTAVTDTLTLLVLALVGGMFKGESGSTLLWLILKVLILGSVIIWLFPMMARRFFRRHEDVVAQFIFVLALVFFGAGLMMFVGMQGILGAFLTGLVLNRLIPKVSVLMNHLEFVGNALFIPYFLIGVGMLLDLKVIFGHSEAILVALVMASVALGGKFLACRLTRLLFRLNRSETWLMYGLSTAQAAATLAAVMVGYNIYLPTGERLLNEDVLNGTVLLILMTCAVSSVITERFARGIALDMRRSGKDGCTMTGKTEKMLVPIRYPENMEDLMRLALLLRDPRGQDNLVALNVLSDQDDTGTRERLARTYLEKMAKIAASANVSLVRCVRYDMNIASGIRHAAREHEATDIVIGLHRKTNLMDSFLGQVTETLIRTLDVQVLVSNFIIPVNTVRRIVVAVPEKAEYEAGFFKWVQQLARLGQQLDCRVHFFSSEATRGHISAIMTSRFRQTMTNYSLLESWDDLLLLTGQVSYDHLLVIISARRGAISYNPAFERLPGQISRYFANNSLLVLFPSQMEDEQEMRVFSNYRSVQEIPLYERIGRWLYRKLMKNSDQ